MPMTEDLERTGVWLFRWRSYLPLGMLALLLATTGHFTYPYNSHALDLAWEMLCLAVSFSGLAVRALTIGYTPKGTSGRNTKEQIADVLNTTGMYSLCRNPLYLGNFLMGLGVMLFPRNWWLSAIYALAFALYYERIIFAEEAFLTRKFGRLYTDWAVRTPAFAPRLRGWRSPELPFSWRNVIRREYHGFYAVIVTMTLIEIRLDRVVTGHFEIDGVWLTILASGTVAYFAVRFFHKWTHALQVKGR